MNGATMGGRTLSATEADERSPRSGGGHDGGNGRRIKW